MSPSLGLGAMTSKSCCRRSIISGVTRLKARTVFFMEGGLIDYVGMASTLTFLRGGCQHVPHPRLQTVAIWATVIILLHSVSHRSPALICRIDERSGKDRPALPRFPSTYFQGSTLGICLKAAEFSGFFLR